MSSPTPTLPPDLSATRSGCFLERQAGTRPDRRNSDGRKQTLGFTKAGGWKRPCKWEQPQGASCLVWSECLAQMGEFLICWHVGISSSASQVAYPENLVIWGMQEEVGLGTWSLPRQHADKCLSVLAPSKNLTCSRLKWGLSKILSLFGTSCFNLQGW